MRRAPLAGPATLVSLVAALAACRAPTRTLLVPVATRAEADLEALYDEWRCPLVVVRDIVYVPPPEALPLAPESVRERLARAAAAPPRVRDGRVLELPAHGIPGHPQFVVRGAGYRRVQVFRGDTLLEQRGSTVRYRTAEDEAGGGP